MRDCYQKLCVVIDKSDSSNIYVNLFFSPQEQFTSFSFKTSSQAFEADNLVVGYQVVNPVPEPASLALLGWVSRVLGSRVAAAGSKTVRPWPDGTAFRLPWTHFLLIVIAAGYRERSKATNMDSRQLIIVGK